MNLYQAHECIVSLRRVRDRHAERMTTNQRKKVKIKFISKRSMVRFKKELFMFRYVCLFWRFTLCLISARWDCLLYQNGGF